MESANLTNQIVKSLSFEVEAAPQNKPLNFTSKSNSLPIDVKIRVKKNKNVEAKSTDVMSKIIKTRKKNRVRLINSDQTIMSFNMLLETDFNVPDKLKSNKYLFGVVKPGGCLDPKAEDEDQYPYLPTSSNIKIKDNTSLDVENVNNDNILSKNNAVKRTHPKAGKNIFKRFKRGGCLDPYADDHDSYSYVPSSSNTKNLKGKVDVNPLHKSTEDLKIFYNCKPGGCLDPPYGEEKYEYKPSSKSYPSTEISDPKIPTFANENKQESHKITHENLSSSQSGKWFRKKISSIELRSKSSRQNTILSFEAKSVHTHANSITNSIITYPPDSSLSDILLNNVTSSLKSESKSCINVKQNAKSVEVLHAYFSPPKGYNRNKKEMSKKELNIYTESNNGIPDAPRIFKQDIKRNVQTEFSLKNDCPTVTSHQSIIQTYLKSRASEQKVHEHEHDSENNSKNHSYTSVTINEKISILSCSSSSPIQSDNPRANIFIQTYNKSNKESNVKILQSMSFLGQDAGTKNSFMKIETATSSVSKLSLDGIDVGKAKLPDKAAALRSNSPVEDSNESRKYISPVSIAIFNFDNSSTEDNLCVQETDENIQYKKYDNDSNNNQVFPNITRSSTSNNERKSSEDDKSSISINNNLIHKNKNEADKTETNSMVASKTKIKQFFNVEAFKPKKDSMQSKKQKISRTIFTSENNVESKRGSVQEKIVKNSQSKNKLLLDNASESKRTSFIGQIVEKLQSKPFFFDNSVRSKRGSLQGNKDEKLQPNDSILETSSESKRNSLQRKNQLSTTDTTNDTKESKKESLQQTMSLDKTTESKIAYLPEKLEETTSIKVNTKSQSVSEKSQDTIDLRNDALSRKESKFKTVSEYNLIKTENSNLVIEQQGIDNIKTINKNDSDNNKLDDSGNISLSSQKSQNNSYQGNNSNESSHRKKYSSDVSKRHISKENISVAKNEMTKSNIVNKESYLETDVDQDYPPNDRNVIKYEHNFDGNEMKQIKKSLTYSEIDRSISYFSNNLRLTSPSPNMSNTQSLSETKFEKNVSVNNNKDHEFQSTKKSPTTFSLKSQIGDVDRYENLSDTTVSDTGSLYKPSEIDETPISDININYKISDRKSNNGKSSLVMTSNQSQEVKHPNFAKNEWSKDYFHENDTKESNSMRSNLSRLQKITVKGSAEDCETEESKYQDNSSIVFLDLSFQNFKDENDRRVLKSIDSSKLPLTHTDGTITTFQSSLKVTASHLSLELDAVNDVSIKYFDKSKLQYVTLPKKQFDLKKEIFTLKPHSKLSCITNDQTAEPTKESHRSSFTTPMHASERISSQFFFHKTLSSIYEEELVPLKNVIKNLKDEIDSLANKRELLREKLVGTRLLKSARLIRVNKHCGCSGPKKFKLSIYPSKINKS